MGPNGAEHPATPQQSAIAASEIEVLVGLAMISGRTLLLRGKAMRRAVPIRDRKRRPESCELSIEFRQFACATLEVITFCTGRCCHCYLLLTPRTTSQHAENLQ